MICRKRSLPTCLRTPAPFHAIGLHYVDFRQLGDDEVLRILAEVNGPPAGTA